MLKSPRKNGRNAETTFKTCMLEFWLNILEEEKCELNNPIKSITVKRMIGYEKM